MGLLCIFVIVLCWFASVICYQVFIDGCQIKNYISILSGIIGTAEILKIVYKYTNITKHKYTKHSTLSSMIHFKADSILVWMKANSTFWAYNTGNFLTYFASALCGRLSHMTDPIKYDIIRQVRSVPPPSCLGTFDDFNKHNVISQRKSKWLILLTLTWQ